MGSIPVGGAKKRRDSSRPKKEQVTKGAENIRHLLLLFARGLKKHNVILVTFYIFHSLIIERAVKLRLNSTTFQGSPRIHFRMSVNGKEREVIRMKKSSICTDKSPVCADKPLSCRRNGNLVGRIHL